eukprot:6412566-Pyramimonas_sp.AAC.1
MVWEAMNSHLGWAMGQNRMKIAIRKAVPMRRGGARVYSSLETRIYVVQYILRDQRGAIYVA